MSLVGLLKGTGKSGFGYNSTADDVLEGLDLSGKTYLVTGCNSGIGAETMRSLAAHGARVIGAARTDAKAKAACDGVAGDTVPVACELSEPESVRSCVERVASIKGRLDGIVCNAGIMALPELEQAHGYELQFFTNHVGHFILVTGLLDKLADDGRVIMTASEGHKGAPSGGIEFDNLSGEDGYNSWRAYGQSKLANILFARHLARRFKGTERVANAVHPGVIDTNLGRHMPGVAKLALKAGAPLVLKSIPQGAATQVWGVAHPDAAGVNGEYLIDCNIGSSSRLARDEELAARLWERTEEIVADL